MQTIRRPLSIDKRWLLGIYTVIPLTLILVLADNIFFEQKLKKILPLSPEHSLLFLFFFNLPHIIASSISFCDREYLSFYKNKLLIPIPFLVLTAFLIPQVFGQTFFNAFLYLWTALHVMGQQFGLTQMMVRAKDVNFFTWKWVGISTAILLYFGIFMPLNHSLFKDTIEASVGVLISVLFLLSFIMGRESPSNLGKSYVWANFGMLASAGLFYWWDYPFFVILVPRFIHDSTAFTFYIVHDVNRNARGTKNFVFNRLRFLPTPILVPLVAMFLAYPLSYFQNRPWVESVIAALTMVHYYTESFAWKGASLHRRATENRDSIPTHGVSLLPQQD